ncbi:MAG: 50S ribosomal protein L10 [Candidatus Aenigmarchaeota archaeon]|nr:50S ribosomal protein L10 [Candidatus Aenigmarchaeota archaeon]
MVSQKKQEAVEQLAKEIGQYPVIGMLDMYKLPARQLLEMRNKLRGRAVIKMAKKSAIKLALQKHKSKGLDQLESRIMRIPALLMSNENPFRLARLLNESKSMAAAKAGDIAPSDIWVRAGPTDLPPGPAIGELQRAKIPAGVQDGKIAVMKDAVVVKKGEVINDVTAGVLGKLKVQPIEIGLNLVAAWEDGTVFDRDVLFTPQEQYLQQLVAAHRNAFSLSLSTGYATKATAPFLIAKAHRAAFALAVEAGIVNKETLPIVFGKAKAQAETIAGRVKLGEIMAAKPQEEQAQQ